MTPKAPNTMVPSSTLPAPPSPLSIWTPNYEAMNQIPRRERAVAAAAEKREQKGSQRMRRKEGRDGDTLRKWPERGLGNGITAHLIMYHVKQR